MPEIIDPVFAKTSQNARFLLSENERFGLVFVKTGFINSGTGCIITVSYLIAKLMQLFEKRIVPGFEDIMENYILLWGRNKIQ